ncbi:MAG: FAD:protein FMN transferase [Clostridia bacterium]|nr:FAD:protein FMN transferase [Clostridia bacterium]
MKTKITAFVISVIMICGTLVGCGKEKVKMHTYEANINSEPFKLTYPVEKDGVVLKTESEIAEIDKACAKAVANALFMFSSENSAGVGEINKSVDAVFDCSEKLMDLLNYTYTVSGITGGKYQPVFGAVTELYKGDSEVTDEAIAEAMTHTGLELITLEENSIIKADRNAKLDYESISAGYALADAAAVLSVNGIDYAVLTYMNTVTTFGQISEKEKVDLAVYSCGSDESYHGVLSFTNAVVTTCNKDYIVIDV